jgi:hypothetical protein
MAKRLQRRAPIAVPRRTRPRIDSAAVTSLFKRVDLGDPSTGGPSTGRPSTGPSTEETPTLPQVPIDIEGNDNDPRSVTRDLYGTPTLQLTPLEVDAIAQGSMAAYMVEPEPDASGFRTVEGLRIALGSSSISPTTVPPAANPRGPRRARQTLRAEKIKSQPVAPDRPPRKR